MTTEESPKLAVDVSAKVINFLLITTESDKYGEIVCC